MKVVELIKKLGEFDPELEVIYWDGNKVKYVRDTRIMVVAIDKSFEEPPQNLLLVGGY